METTNDNRIQDTSRDVSHENENDHENIVDNSNQHPNKNKGITYIKLYNAFVW